MFRLLIVDDEWIIREGLEKTIPWQEWGIQLAGSAKNGEEGLAMLHQQSIDILLTDIRMPGLNGLELIEKCKVAFPHLKIVILSGHSEFDYAQRALKLGADDFLLKPTNIIELKHTMERIINELTANRINEESLLALLLKNVLENPTLESMERLDAYHQLVPNYGIVIIQSDKLVLEHQDRKYSVLIDQQGNEAVYLFHHVENELHWEQLLHEIHPYKQGKLPTQVRASLLGNNLEQLNHLYNQAKSAATIFFQEENITIYQYKDDKYALEIERVITYIDKNHSKSLCQAELAEALHMSNSYFSRLFKQHTGMNFVDYLTTKRLEIAKQLLRTTTLKIHEIAKDVGYPESRYFSQLFKKNIGLTPMEYRNIADE